MNSNGQVDFAIKLIGFAAVIFASRFLSIVALIATTAFFWYALIDPQILRVVTACLYTGLVTIPLFLIDKGGIRYGEKNNVTAVRERNFRGKAGSENALTPEDQAVHSELQ